MNTYVVGNWKMNLAPKEAADLAREIRAGLSQEAQVETWVCPTTLSIPATVEACADSPLKVGAQNAYFESSGAFTGEVSVAMLQSIGASFSLVGHSERRAIFGESIELCTNRAKGMLEQSFRTIFCVGETLADRERQETNTVLEGQLSPLLQEISADESRYLIVAYEPVWAIGTGKVASVKEIAEAHAFLNKLCATHLSGRTPAILYGGSVKPENFAAILEVPNVNGALVGGASLKAESFLKLVEIASTQ